MNERGRRPLLRLHRWRVKERQRVLADLETMRAQLLAQIEALDAELLAEQDQAAASFEAHLAYAAYAEVACARRAKLLSSIAELETARAAAQEALAEAFRELKKHEIAAACCARSSRARAARAAGGGRDRPRSPSPQGKIKSFRRVLARRRARARRWRSPVR